MGWDKLEGSWQELKGAVRQKWGKLTDQDLEQIGGAKDRLVGALKTRYGYEKDKATTEAESWIKTLEDKITGRDKGPTH